MGCGGSKDTMQRPSSKLTVYGDYFNSDTRAIIGILKFAKIPHAFEEVNIFQEDQKKPAYLAINPSGQIPMVSEGQFKIIGGGNNLITYVMNAHKNVSDLLYPEECKAEVEKYLNWFLSKMRPETQRLIRMIVPAKVFGGAPATQEMKVAQRKVIFQNHGILDALNTQIQKSGLFVCGSHLTVVDIVFYCEIATIMALTNPADGAQLISAMPHIHEWQQRVSAVEGMADLDKKLQAIVVKFNLAEN